MSKIPEGWKHVELGDVCKFKGGNAFKESFQGKSSGMYPFIKVSDMNLVGNETTIVNAANWLDEDIRQMIKAFLFPINTTVFAKVGAALLLNRRRLLSRPTIIDNNMMGAIPNASIDFKFLYYILTVIDFSIFVQDGAVPSVNQGQLECLHSLLPPLEEQKKIAEILSSVDRSIEATEKLIAKLSDLKKALMQELFTKGIGHSRFKNSPLGKIPEEWEVVKLSELIISLEAGVSVNSEDRIQQSGEIAVLKTSCLTGGIFNPLEHKVIIREDYNRVSCPVTKDTIIISRMNTPQLVGESAYVSKDYSHLFLPDRLWKTIVSQNVQIDVRWLAYYMQTSKFKDDIAMIATGTSGSMKNISKSAFLAILIALPSFKEQKHIASILSANDAKIEKAQKRLEKLKDMKKALMQDLLTGKKRVNHETH